VLGWWNAGGYDGETYCWPVLSDWECNRVNIIMGK